MKRKPETTKCPNCCDGRIFAAFPHNVKSAAGIECDVCKGTGVLPDDIVYDPVRGGQIKKMRFDKQMTLRMWCIHQHIDACEQSRMERGFFRGKK